MTKMAHFKGKDIEVEEIETITQHEPWNEYQLSNGKVVMAKMVLIEVQKAVDEKNPDGSDMYLTKFAAHIRVK